MPNVSANVLKKVLEWCEHHKKDPEPLAEDQDDTRRKTTEISDWDAKFIQVDQEMLFEIILAANYLDIKPLLSVLPSDPHFTSFALTQDPLLPAVTSAARLSPT